MTYFRDLNLFTPKDSPEVTDAQAIRQELAMLFNTRPPERLFDPEYGIALDSYLFDLISNESATTLFFMIVDQVEKYVTSCVIDKQASMVIPDPDNNTYILNLYFNIVGAVGGSYQMTKTFTSG